MKTENSRNWLVYIGPVVIFAIFAGWWFYIRQFDLDSTRNVRQLWGATYQILALYGGLSGLFIAQKWGGYQSQLGRTILAFSLGLLLQVFGQSYSSYYVYHYVVESPPYPAIGDIGFFGSVLAYIYAVFSLAKVSGLSFSLKKIHNKILVVVLPCLVVVVAYLFFLKGYEFSDVGTNQIFLDFGYPIGQALYVSIAIISLFISGNLMGGMLRSSILLLIFALLFQYFSDCMFLYQASMQAWYVGNINDFLYTISYFVMTISLLQLGQTFHRIKSS